jgi:hypothetical protein
LVRASRVDLQKRRRRLWTLECLVLLDLLDVLVIVVISLSIL